MPIKPWFNEVHPLPTKSWRNMTQQERNRESSRRSIEEDMLRDNCKKLKLKRVYKHFNKGDELFFRCRMLGHGVMIFMVREDNVDEKFCPYTAVYRNYFDYVDE